MKQLKLFFTSFLFFFLLPLSAHAQCVGNSTGKSDFIVLFVNGILNKKDDVMCSADKLQKLLVSHGLNEKSFDYDLFHNQTQGVFSDVDELKEQAIISGAAWKQSRQEAGTVILPPDKVELFFRNAYYKKLGEHYYYSIFERGLHRTESGVGIYLPVHDLVLKLQTYHEARKQVVLVAHSQGNYLVEAAYAVLFYLEEKKYPENTDKLSPLLSAIRVVGVASVASSTPHNRYVSLKQDKALASHIVQTGDIDSFSVLSLNFLGCVLDSASCDLSRDVADFDEKVHSFVDIYLNERIAEIPGMKKLAQLIYEYIEVSLKELGFIFSQQPALHAEFRFQNLIYGVGNPIFLDASSSDVRTTKFSWDYGDGRKESFDSKTSKFSTAYSVPGKYIITLRVENETGSTGICQAEVVVEQKLIPPKETSFTVCR